MKVVELHPPINGGTVYFGYAESTRHRRYSLTVLSDGEAGGVFREDKSGSFWRQIKPPAALKVAVLSAVQV